MSQENAKKLIELLSTNEALRATLKELSKVKDKDQVEADFVEIAKKNGCECSTAEFMEAQKSVVSELSQEDLSKVDAGFSYTFMPHPEYWVTFGDYTSRDSVN